MKAEQIKIYTDKLKYRHQIFITSIVIGLLFEIVSIGITARAGEIVTAGTLPAFIATVLFIIGIFGCSNTKKKIQRLLVGKYKEQKKIVTDCHKSMFETVYEFKDDTQAYKMSETVGTVSIGDKISLIHWLESDKYSVVQLDNILSTDDV